MSKVKSVTKIQNKMYELYQKHGQNYRMPAKFSNLEAIYDTWNYEKIISELRFEEEESKLIKKI